MKFINKILITIIFNLLPLFFLISCSGSGNCLPSGVTPSTLNITLTSASSYPSGVAEKIPLIVTNVGITAINKLNYTVTLNTTGVNITLDASNCSSLTVNASCTLWASLPAGSNPGTFAVAAGWSTVDSNATAGKIVNKLNSLLNNTLTAKVYIGLVDTPTNSEPNSAGITLYYPPMVVANPNQATTVIISALVSSQYAGTFNTIQLLDSSGNLLAATVLTGNSGSQLTNLTMGDVVTFAVVIPTGSTQYQFKLQTLENGVVQSTGTNLNVINLVNQTQIVGILNVSPNYFNLTQYYESQIITLNNSGTGDITDLKITPVSPLSKISTSCGKTLAVHDSCEYIVTFDKSQPLAGTTSVGIDYNSTSSMTVHASATVNYTGSNAVAGLSIRSGSNPNFDFSSTTTNNTASTVVTVTNIGNNIESNISVSNLPAVFSLSTQGVTNACSSASGFSLAAGQSCALNLTYVNSVITNSTNQQVTFTYNYLTLSGSASTSSNIMLTWQTTPPRAIISFSPSSFNYGTILNDGAESVSTTFTITNNGDASATGANLTFQPNNSLFNISGGTCQAPPAAGASCTLVVQFGPTNAVPQNVSTQMILDYVPYSGAPLVSTSVALNGIIAAVNAGVMTESAGAISGFAGGDGTAATAYQVEQNATHPTVVYNISNAGAANTTNFTVTPSGLGNWSSTNNCPASLNSGATCQIIFSLDTTTVGSNNLNLANISLSWNDPTHQTNQARQSLSGIVYANVYTPPRITTTPASASILRGESAVFTVSLTGGYNVADNNTITLIDPNAATDGLSITSTPSLCVLGQTVSSCIFTIHASSSAPIASNTLSVSNSNHDISTTPTSISVVVTPRYYPFFFPWGITLNSAGTIAFITNQNSNIVTQCSVFESTLSSCTNSGATGLYRPGVIVLNSTGDIAFITVGDVPAFQCSVSAGNLSNCANSGATGILNSGGIVLSPDETLAFITNSSGGNIGSYHLSGSTLSGYVYSGATNLSNPSFIVLNQSGSTAFITNWGNNTVTQCSVNGGTLSNCTNSGATGLNNPTGIVLNSAEDIIFIVNTGNNTVTQCSVNGNILSNCSNSGATGLSWPGGIVLNSSGTLAFITSPSNDGTADGKIIQCSVNGGTLSNCAQTGIID